MRRSLHGTVFAAAGALAIGAAAGCRVTAPEIAPPAPPAAITLPASRGADSMDLNAAVAHALATSARLHMLRLRVDRAAADAAGVRTPKSPELRFGAGREHQNGVATSFQTESGQQHETDTSETHTEIREFGVVTEESDRTGHSSRNTRSSQQTFSAENSRADEDNFDVSLRFSPPSPWRMAAAGDAAEAARQIAVADLQAEEQDLACSVADVAVRLAQGVRAIEVRQAYLARCEALRRKVRAAAADGNAPQSDEVDVVLRLASAHADLDRLKLQQARLRQEFRTLTGLNADAVRLADLPTGAILRVKDALALPTERLTSRRADIVTARWTMLRHEAEWREARIRRYPWLSHMEVSYAWWNGVQRSNKTTDKRGTESSTETGSSTETETFGYDVENREDHGTSSETSTSHAEESLREHTDGDEWWIGVGIEIPIFEWLSSEVPLRRTVAQHSQRTLEDLLARARDDILAAAMDLRTTRAELDTSRQSLESQARDLQRLAAAARVRGMAGEIEASRMEERLTELAVRHLERRMDALLAELAFCRAAGLMPGRQQPEDPRE